MSSYLSNILTNTTSRYNSLRQTLISSEADGDTEDDSHISRVLRAYYTEKGRQLPPWLPPDPRRTASSQSVPTPFTSSLRTASSQSVGQSGGQGGRGSLNDLWDQPTQSAAPQQPMSLRRQAAERGGSSYQVRSQETLQPPPQARPLPSQRAGSYQTQMSQQQQQQSQQSDPYSQQGSGPGGTAQERLKARLWGGGRSASPTPSAGSGTGAPASPNLGQQRFGGGGAYDNSGAYGGRYGR
ncbi:hypothetical protein MBLNU459_g0898t1 [Dothideomycetes sp. NU459]